MEIVDEIQSEDHKWINMLEEFEWAEGGDSLPEGWGCANLKSLMVVAQDKSMTAKRFQLLFYLAWMADNDRNELHCSVKTIADATKLSKGMVNTALHYFNDRGWVERLSPKGACWNGRIRPDALCKKVKWVMGRSENE